MSIKRTWTWNSAQNWGIQAVGSQKSGWAWPTQVPPRTATAGNQIKNTLLKLLPSMKTSFSFAGLKFLGKCLHTPGLNVCRYCSLRCFKSPTRALFCDHFAKKRTSHFNAVILIRWNTRMLRCSAGMLVISSISTYYSLLHIGKYAAYVSLILKQ